ncbi:MAG: helix-turn-helix domain-containing protein [Oscillospiraceae bacterium]|nr:helix-turn-helix domain-containing protein [Oscillospiraceae bacterium]
MEKTVLTVKEAAAIMRISPSSMYKLVKENKAPHICIGKRRVIPAQPFYNWLNTIVTGG